MINLDDEERKGKEISLEVVVIKRSENDNHFHVINDDRSRPSKSFTF